MSFTGLNGRAHSMYLKEIISRLQRINHAVNNVERGIDRIRKRGHQDVDDDMTTGQRKKLRSMLEEQLHDLKAVDCTINVEESDDDDDDGDDDDATDEKVYANLYRITMVVRFGAYHDLVQALTESDEYKPMWYRRDNALDRDKMLIKYLLFVRGPDEHVSKLRKFVSMFAEEVTSITNVPNDPVGFKPVAGTLLVAE